MPNHVHMILTVQDAGNGGSSRAPTPARWTEDEFYVS